MLDAVHDEPHGCFSRAFDVSRIEPRPSFIVKSVADLYRRKRDRRKKNGNWPVMPRRVADFQAVFDWLHASLLSIGDSNGVLDFLSRERKS
jgi:hypothetical protein